MKIVLIELFPDIFKFFCRAFQDRNREFDNAEMTLFCLIDYIRTDCFRHGFA